MSTLAIISEYNPYHLGHAYLLEESRRITGADCAISVMSGNFSQQGLPMMADKLTRASAAAASGIDLIFELPVLYATGSAREFADGAVRLLEGLHSVDHLCFGVEDPDPELLHAIADQILQDDQAYRELLYLKKHSGKNYPKAREDALAEALGERVRPVLHRPNNILAIEYLVCLKRLSSPIRPVFIHRAGSYHAASVSAADTSSAENISRSSFASASAIRRTLSGSVSGDRQGRLSLLQENLPAGSFSVYRDLTDRPPLQEDAMTPFLAAALITLEHSLSENDLPQALPMDMTPDLYRRLTHIPLPVTWTELVEQLNTRNMTRGRITRTLLHMILGITNSDREMIRKKQPVPYANLLGAREGSTHLLRFIQEKADFPLITKRSEYLPAGHSAAELLWKYDCRATDLYNQLYFNACGERKKDELRSTPVIRQLSSE